jgi:hypothetical protein
METDLVTLEIAHEDGSMLFTELAIPKQSVATLSSLTAYEILLFESNVPSNVRDIAALIGMQLTVILISKCRGNSLRLHGKDFKFLVSLLGIDAAEKLKKWMGGVELIIPTCRKAFSAIIHSRIRCEFDKLTTIDKISARAAVRNLTNFVSPPIHERSIWRILKKTDDLCKSLTN